MGTRGEPSSPRETPSLEALGNPAHYVHHSIAGHRRARGGMTVYERESLDGRGDR
jgi:hypothetical protein